MTKASVLAALLLSSSVGLSACDGGDEGHALSFTEYASPVIAVDATLGRDRSEALPRGAVDPAWSVPLAHVPVDDVAAEGESNPLDPAAPPGTHW